VTTDEGFREIQLNGKQLVFLFMAALVVSVVIFLCGVLVGRDVRPDRSAPVDTAAAAPVVPDSAAARAVQTAAAPAQPADPPAPAEDLSYFDRLQKSDTPHETLKLSAPQTNAPAAPAPAKAAPPAPVAAKAPLADGHPGVTVPGEPAGPGFAIQVLAYPDRRIADTMAKRLMDKGYKAYVAPTSAGSKTLYRVRVGKFKEKRDADAVALRLKNEEQFSTWVTR
jgi:cell division septation protein DedD